MNKKFSTLVASLLLTSAFSVYSVDAKPMLATPTQVETRAAAADVEDAVEWPGTLTKLANYYQAQVLPGFTNNARLFVVRQDGTYTASDVAANNLFVRFNDATGVNQAIPDAYNSTSGVPANAANFYWTLKNGQLIDNAGNIFTADGAHLYYEVIPVVSSNPTDPTYYFVLGTRNSDGSLSYVNFVGTTVGGGSLSTFGLVSDLEDAATFCSIETEYNENVSAADLMAKWGEGDCFKMSITSKIDEDATVLNADVFAGKLKAVNQTGNYYQLQNEAGKFIVFDTNVQITSDPNAIKGQFKLVDNPNQAGLLDQFCVSVSDNSSEDIIVKVNGADTDNPNVGIDPYRLYIANTSGTYALSIADYWARIPASNTIDVIDWAKVTIGNNNIVDLREFLTGDFYTVDFVKAATPGATNEYKNNGRLAVRETDKPDYVEAKSLYEKAPEAQWAVSGTVNATVNGGKPYFNDEITLTNRENPTAKVTIKQLRRIDGVGLLVEDVTSGTGLEKGDIIKITAVTDHTKNDGYEVFSDNDLKNETYHLGQLRQTADGDINVYWAENHNASHQIGATVDSLKATRWNLSLVKKANAGNDYVGQTDSVLVVSELQNWNDTKNRIDVKKDTLVILPYAFQNRSNSEFAEFNDGTNLDYYQCNVYNQGEKKVYKYGEDAMFALKRKADVDGQPVYNYVMLNAKEASDYTKGAVNAFSTAYAEEKVYQENSTDRGTWKNMQMYAGDANALMFVNKVYAPEYRKLVTTANLDTIKLYRADNEAQVVYEKKDAKSVVEGDTLSFLNIDNETQFTTINPALYADTAYVNRGDNTCWQYLLGVNIEHKEGYYCPEHGFGETEPCTHAVWVSYNKGRYLMNMIDTANVYGKTAGIHNNPYINETEEGLTCAKLSFVDAIHVLTDEVNPAMSDKLYVINNGDTTAVDLGTPDFNTVKFAFKYTDSMESDEFKIQTQWKEYDPTTYGTGAYNNNGANFSQEGYLRWVNGCIVVDKGYQKGDVFNMNEDETRTPTANEEISAEEATVSVVATDGAVIVKGAEGKNVIVSTILGKVVANEVVNSDNETIAAPAGIVVVSVDGESFKVAVK